MSFLSKSSAPLLRVLPAAMLVAALCGPHTAGAEEELPVSHPLPDVTVRALDSREDVSLVRALAGRPAVVVLTEARSSTPCPSGAAAAELQRDFAPWFSWVAVLSGEFTAAEIGVFRDRSPLRVERLYLDRAGALREGLGIERLPALVLLDEDGSVHEICSGSNSTARLEETAQRLQRIATASRRERGGFADFRLPIVGGTGLVSFLDVAGRESTVVSFIHCNCLPCAQQIGVLDYVRDLHAGATTFVTVFLDEAPDSRVRGFLAAAGATPDFVLRDPELRLARRYAIDTVPALLVIDADGSIVMSRSGYREEEREVLFHDVESALASSALSAAARGPALVEARRIHEEACAFMQEGKPEFALMYQERIREILPEYQTVYLRIAEAALAIGDRDLAVRSLARYLETQPQDYGRTEVTETISNLIGSEP